MRYKEEIAIDVLVDAGERALKLYKEGDKKHAETELFAGFMEVGEGPDNARFHAKVMMALWELAKVGSDA